MNKFLITGISGFVGPNLAKILIDNGHEVHGVIRSTHGRETDLLDTLCEKDLSKIQFHYLDLKDEMDVKNLLSKEDFDGIFHLAAQSHPPTSFNNPILTFNENVNASLHLITHCNTSKFMFASTSEVYGNQCTDNGWLKETSMICPVNPYGCSKASIDLYVQERMKNKFVDAFITRAFSHTGIRRGKIFSISNDAYQIVKIKKGLQDKRMEVGNLKSKRSVLDVRDCANAYYLLMISDKTSGEIYNVGATDVYEMEYFTNSLIKIAGFEVGDIEKVVSPKLYRPIDIHVQRPDITKIKSTIEWTPKYTIEKTLESLYDYWYRKIN
jgi:GDP-mannose 4,6-dehydratase